MAEPPRSDQPSKPTGGVETCRNPASTELVRAVPVVIAGFVALGTVSTLELLLPIALDADSTASRALRPVFGVIWNLVVYGLLGWLAARFLRAASAIVDAVDRRAEESGSPDRALAESLARLAEVLDRPPVSPTPVEPPAVSPPAAPTDPKVVFREALQNGRWAEAESIVHRYLEERPEDPEASRLSRELAEARATTAGSLRDKIDAARQVNDPQRVLDLRDELMIVLEGDELRSFDQETVRWFMVVIQKRLRTGKIGLDVAELAGKVAERFDHTSEGASLRAALPTLRRSAGLCPRCGLPYTGIADACPACLGSASFPAFAPDQPPETDEPDSESEMEFD